MTPKSLLRKIKGLRVEAPITASYERALVAHGVWSNKGVWLHDAKRALAGLAIGHEPEGDFAAASQHAMNTMTVPNLLALSQVQS